MFTDTSWVLLVNKHLKMTTAQVAETSVTVNNNSPIQQDYVHPDDQTQPTFEMTPGFKPLTNNSGLLTNGKNGYHPPYMYLSYACYRY